MFRFLIHKLCRPCYQVFLFGRTFYLARITNSAYLGTLGCVGFLILAQIFNQLSSVGRFYLLVAIHEAARSWGGSFWGEASPQNVPCLPK